MSEPRFVAPPCDTQCIVRRPCALEEVPQVTLNSNLLRHTAVASKGQWRDMLSQHWAKDAKYVDPLTSGEGHDGVDALIAGVQQRFPDFRFHLIGEPNGFGDHVRFSWGLGPDGADSPIKGTDFAVVSDGRIRSITGFLDQVPQGA
jgi:hypothetical protein